MASMSATAVVGDARGGVRVEQLPEGWSGGGEHPYSGAGVGVQHCAALRVPLESARTVTSETPLMSSGRWVR